jgi:hypothetical protein
MISWGSQIPFFRSRLCPRPSGALSTATCRPLVGAVWSWLFYGPSLGSPPHASLDISWTRATAHKEADGWQNAQHQGLRADQRQQRHPCRPRHSGRACGVGDRGYVRVLAPPAGDQVDQDAQGKRNNLSPRPRRATRPIAWLTGHDLGRK